MAVPAEAFDARFEEVTARLAAGPTRAYAELKGLFRSAYETDLATHLDRERDRIAALAETDDYAAGLAGFLGDEDPEFEGR